MKRVVVGHYGGPEVLQVVEEDDPRPGPGEVRVRVLAAGVSFRCRRVDGVGCRRGACLCAGDVRGRGA